MEKTWLITDSGWEHTDIIAIVTGPKSSDIESLKKEFEDLLQYKPSCITDVWSEDKYKNTKSIEARNKLINLGLIKNENYYNENLMIVSEFLCGFVNWLVKEKNFSELKFDICGYHNKI